MSVPAIAFYASPPSSSILTSHHSCHVVASSSSSQGSSSSSSSSLDFGDVVAVGSRPSSSSSSASPSTIMKPPLGVGGLSLMFSSSLPIKHSSSSSYVPPPSRGESDDLSCCSSSYSYSPFNASSLKSSNSRMGAARSPVSVLLHHNSFSYYGGSGSLRGFVDFKSTGRDRLLFRRFVTHALGSCLDYDPPSLPIPTFGGGGGPTIGLDEFPLVMDESFAGTICEPYAQVMLSNAQSRHGIFKDEFVVKAFYESERAHRGQMRASGDRYLQHCVETAILLADIGASATVVTAGLLHDTLDDSFIDHGYISREFGSAVANLVQGVSKLSHLSKLARDNNTACESAEADKLHTMFLAMADARAVLIKLADRLHNMMTLDALPMIKRQRFAKETLEIFAPLANRLGIFSWKEQLENLCFKHLNPDQHKYLSSKLLKTFDEAMIASAKDELGQALHKEGLAYHALYGRHKSLYSIYSKMQKKNLTMNEIHDIHGLRLIVENGDDCYKALDVVHRLWPKVAERYKDYIKNPKDNGYQSLHTVVLSKGGVPLEVQIRTKEMHLQAEFGFAAHWRYKEGGCKHSSFVLQMVEWARWVLTWHCETSNKDQASSFTDRDPICSPCSFPCHSDSCPFSYTPLGEHDRPVFVILLENDKMSVQEMNPNSTLMNLFERISWGTSHWGARSYPTKEEIVRAKLNHEQVADPNQKLKMGDVVELPRKSLREYREEIKRMYDHEFAISIGK